ncbi:hypothetical protein CsSME_00034489 [Camellia sinensis var. sinensis]
MGSYSSEPRSMNDILEFAELTMEDDDNNNNPRTGLLSRRDDEKDPGLKNKAQKKTKKKKKKQVFLEGYVEAADEDDLTRTKSLTDEDLEELKGCLDLGFGFSYDEIPELCNTLPALELCYSMSQRFLDDQQKSPDSPSSAAAAAVAETCSPASGPIANWKISSPGDHPEEVKARLKYWAQAVACTPGPSWRASFLCGLCSAASSACLEEQQEFLLFFTWRWTCQSCLSVMEKEEEEEGDRFRSEINQKKPMRVT